MAEPTPVLAPGQLEGPVYRSLSLLAVAALVIAAGFAAVVSILGVVAFVSGMPLFMGIVTFAVPVASLSMAIAARYRIRHSEGVLGGLALTTWAWWLSLLFGLGYGAFYLGTLLAVWAQANTFTEKWFELLRQGKTNEAFLATVDPATRRRDRPSDRSYMFEHYGTGVGKGKGPLATFSESELVRVVQQAGPRFEIKSQGIKDWMYKNGYQVEVPYRITTREGEFDVLMTVLSSEGPEIEGRQWSVVWDKSSIVSAVLNPEGVRIQIWRQLAAAFTSEWIADLHAGDVEAMFLATLPVGERRSLARQFRLRLALAGLAAGSGDRQGLPLGSLVYAGLLNNPQQTRFMYLPGYAEYLGANVLKYDGFEALRHNRADILQQVLTRFKDPVTMRFRMVTGQDSSRPRTTNQESGTVQMLQDVEIGVFPAGQTPTETPQYQCDSVFVIQINTRPDAPAGTGACRLSAIELLRGGVPPTPPGKGK
jgi:hypothetical protein